jgi:hypothetical protein
LRARQYLQRHLTAARTLCDSTQSVMSTGNEAAAPTGATDAVLKPSEPVPADAKEVQGIDFNQYANRSITVEELIGGYSNMGFQATSVAEAVRIINGMVSLSARGVRSPGAETELAVHRPKIGPPSHPRSCASRFLLTGDSAHGRTRRPMRGRRSSWATRPI